MSSMTLFMPSPPFFGPAVGLQAAAPPVLDPPAPAVEEPPVPGLPEVLAGVPAVLAGVPAVDVVPAVLSRLVPSPPPPHAAIVRTRLEAPNSKNEVTLRMKG
jgi:hypothetical protein